VKAESTRGETRELTAVQLLSLKRQISATGHESIDTLRGAPDDVATNAVCRASHRQTDGQPEPGEGLGGRAPEIVDRHAS
jgi:hypothetical protein